MREIIIRLFFSMSGRMRWGWRLALFVISLFLLLILLSPLAYFWGETPFRPKDGIDIKVNAWIAFLAILLVSAASVKYFDKRPLGSLGLKLHEAWGQELFIGICVGAILFLLQLSVALALPSVERTVATLDLQSLFLTLIEDFRGAVGEELLFRGFPLQTLIGGIGVVPALFVSSVLFGLAHLQEQSWLGVVNAGGGGILLAVSYLKTRALWMPLGIHFAFNYFGGLLEMLVGIHFILSTPLVLVTLLLDGAALIFILRFIKPHPKMEALWQRYVPVAQPWAQLKSWWARGKGHPAPEPPEGKS